MSDDYKRTYSQIDDWSDSRELLANARKQANQRNFDDVFIVDIDSHISDGGAWPEIMDLVEDPVVRDAASAFGDGSKRGGFPEPHAGSAVAECLGPHPSWSGPQGTC
jgi:hypothetical protein